MRTVLTLAIILIIPAIAMAGWDAYKFYEGSMVTFRFTTFGSLWYSLNPDSIDMVRNFTQENLPPFVWDPVIQQLLLWPGAAVLAIPSTTLFTIWGGHGLLAENWSGEEYVGNKKARVARARKAKDAARKQRLAERARKRRAMERYKAQRRTGGHY